MVALRARRPWRIGLVALAALALLLAPSAPGDEEEGFLKAYKEGLSAIEERRWQLAAEKMRQAVEGRSEEKSKLFKKAYLRPYLPHYYLGVALFEMGDCAGALASWTESERQGVVTERKVYEDLQRSRDRCEEMSLSSPDSAPPAANTESLSQAQDEPRDQRTAERQAPAPPPRARPRQEPSSSESRQALERRVVEIERGLGQLARGEPEPPRVAELRAELGRLLAEARALGTGAGEPEIARLTAALETAYGTFRLAADPPPPKLDLAARAYLDGDYPEALRLLEGFSTLEMRATAHAHLLRAAAHFATHRIGGDGEHLRRAEEEARAARLADPELAPPDLLFSHAFRNLFLSLDASPQEN